MTTEAGIAAGGRGGSVGTDAAGAPNADSSTQDAAEPAVPPSECIPTCLWEVLSSCIDPGATAVAPDSGGCVRDADHWLEEPRALVCDADDQFYFVTPSTGSHLSAWSGSCYVGGRLMYTKRPLPGGPAFLGAVLFEDAEGRNLVEVVDPYSSSPGPTVYCGGRDAEGAGGGVMLLGEALDLTGHVIVDHPCAPWVALVSHPANEYYWPGCTPGDCPDPPAVPMDASMEGGRVEADGAP